MQKHISLYIQENLSIWIQELISEQSSPNLRNMINFFYEERIT